MEILEKSHILILTPDIIHAWLLYNLSSKPIIDLLANISLIIIDEIHNYTGVFGSNSAYLFRRIQHLMYLLNASPQYISASATIAKPEIHLKNLLGIDFRIIGTDFDSSPRQEISIKLVKPLKNKDLLANLSDLMRYVAKNTNHKFITFVDSRKQTEYIASIISRISTNDKEDDDFGVNHLRELNILPYRAGYEENDRITIQERLTKGMLTGVVSTSALELGIDIPYLTLGVLLGVPHSATSLYQRIGRIARQSKGEVIIINTGDIYNESIFRNPKQLLNMPLSEGALYLKNPRIQYIHTLCLARHGGEHDQICTSINMDQISDFESSIDWPSGFMGLCRSERIGEIPTELQNMKAQAVDDPNHTFPLRDTDIQFRVKYKKGPHEEYKGSLSYGQLMREAYPGAIYYYTTKSYRVYRVRISSRIVEVRKEKKYMSKPSMIPTLVFPNLTLGNIFISQKYGDLIAAECNLQIREAIIGFQEFRGPNKINIKYPLNRSLGLYFDQSRFTRNYFTTGIILSHPIFNNPNVHCDIIANLLFEAFLMLIPFERRDIDFACDKFRANKGIIHKGDKFISIYDQVYGSLRLSGHILSESILEQTIEKAVDLSKHERNLNINRKTIMAIEKLLNSVSSAPSELSFENEGKLMIDMDRYAKVILPGSKGIDIGHNNEEFFVELVFFHPRMNGLAYTGRRLSQENPKYNDVKISIPISLLKEIPGESKIGLYDFETGELKEIE